MFNSCNQLPRVRQTRTLYCLQMTIPSVLHKMEFFGSYFIFWSDRRNVADTQVTGRFDVKPTNESWRVLPEHSFREAASVLSVLPSAFSCKGSLHFFQHVILCGTELLLFAEPIDRELLDSLS